MVDSSNIKAFISTMISTFAASSATKEEIEKAKAENMAGKCKPIELTRRIYQPKVTSDYAIYLVE